MTTLETRVLHLEKRRPRRPAPSASSFDPTRLTFGEQIERMTDGELERCYDLSRKGEGHPPSPAYRYMPHRDPGIGPCRCAGCEPTTTRPTDDDHRPDPAV